MDRQLRKLKNDFIYYGARLLMLFIGFLPFPWVGRLGQLFGAAIFRISSGERRKTLASIRIAFSNGLTPDEMEQLARQVWTGLGRNLFEVVRWTTMSTEKITAQVARVEGWENLERALTRGKGALLVTAHLGNWELLGAYIASRHPTTGVAKPLYDPRFDKLVTQLRTEKLKANMTKRGTALRGILEALRQNHVIVALCDQDTGKDGIFVPFFGKAAWTQSGVARIAKKTGTAIVPAFMVRGSDGQFELHVEKEIEVPDTGDEAEDITETVWRYTEVIESYVRLYTNQWMWMHQRWKTRPQLTVVTAQKNTNDVSAHYVNSLDGAADMG